jgi:hypothetical protein
MPYIAHAFGGSVELEAAPAKYSMGVGNLHKDYVSYTIYNYATQQAVCENVGNFTPYLYFGMATDADPLNPIDGTFPKSATAVATKFVGFLSESYCDHTHWYIVRMHTSDLRPRAGCG